MAAAAGGMAVLLLMLVGMHGGASVDLVYGLAGRVRALCCVAARIEPRCCSCLGAAEPRVV